MAGPPNTVAVASAIPTNYFASASGAAASVPVTFTAHGHIQPWNVEDMSPSRPFMPGVIRSGLAGALDSAILYPGTGGKGGVVGEGGKQSLIDKFRARAKLGVQQGIFPPGFQPVGQTPIGGPVRALLNNFQSPVSWWRGQWADGRFGVTPWQ